MAKSGSAMARMRAEIGARAKMGEIDADTKKSWLRSCKEFRAWAAKNGISNNMIARDPRGCVQRWSEWLAQPGAKRAMRAIMNGQEPPAEPEGPGYATSSIHTMIAGVCAGLCIDMTGICRTWTADEKRKSVLGGSDRAERARMREMNQDIVNFQTMVGGRRKALERLTGADLVQDESGEWCVHFKKDKGGKEQLQRVAPENLSKVRKFFDAVEPDERLFPRIDKNLDLHGIRAEHARNEYARYAEICSTPEGRAEMRRQLWRRFENPRYGNKNYLISLACGDTRHAQAARDAFYEEMRDGQYELRGANRDTAERRGRPVSYDRLALCCVSVFALSHWRNEVTVKSYMI